MEHIIKVRLSATLHTTLVAECSNVNFYKEANELPITPEQFATECVESVLASRRMRKGF